MCPETCKKKSRSISLGGIEICIFICKYLDIYLCMYVYLCIWIYCYNGSNCGRRHVKIKKKSGWMPFGGTSMYMYINIFMHMYIYLYVSVYLNLFVWLNCVTGNVWREVQINAPWKLLPYITQIKTRMYIYVTHSFDQALPSVYIVFIYTYLYTSYTVGFLKQPSVYLYIYIDCCQILKANI